MIPRCVAISDPSSLNKILKTESTTSALTILSVNIRSINCNFDMFLVFLSLLGTPIDVLVLTECWTNEHIQLPNITNYTLHYTKKKLNQNDGVVAYVREGLEAVSNEPPIEEGNCLVLCLGEQFTIVCSYRPPCYSNPTKYLNSLTPILRNLRSHNVILTGDINIDTLPENISGHAADYLALMASLGLWQGVNRPTRITACLDHFMVKSSLQWRTVVFDPLTDHSPILLQMENISTKKTPSDQSKLTIDYNVFREKIALVKWEEYYQIDDANLAANVLIDKIQITLDCCSSIKRFSNRKRPLKPWITAGVVRSIRKRDKLHIKFKLSPNNSQLKTTYLKYRNACNKLIKSLKIQYYAMKLESNKGNIKNTWQVIKELCNLNNNKTSAESLLKTNPTPAASLNLVNDYFTSIGQQLANNILSKMEVTEDELKKKCSSLVDSPLQSFFFIPTDPREISTTIKTLKTNSAPGEDLITHKVLKIACYELAEPIAHLCNLSFATSTFPRIFKKAVVTPIYKAGDPCSPTNYRPISLLATISKVIEKIVNKRLVKFLEDHNLLASNQYGFRARKSTNDAVLKLTSLITTCLDRGDKCIGVFLDLQKAFDTVSIPILLTRLETLGIRAAALDWFCDYLTNREQCVRIGEHRSDVAQCTFGVPQGSTLGPTLFLAYINPLNRLDLGETETIMFADDTVLLFHANSWASLGRSVERCMCKVTAWLENSLLSLNTSKTKYMCFSKTRASRPDSNFKIYIHTYPCNRYYDDAVLNCCTCPVLERVDFLKYLGVIIDDKLHWGPHISAVAARLRKLIYVFKNLRTVANSELCIKTYRALGECIADYCVCSWGGAGKVALKEAERAQRAALKVMLHLPFRYPTTDLYLKCNVLSIRKIYILQCILRYHRVTVPGLPANNNKRLDICPKPNVRSAMARRNFNFHAPMLYNLINIKIAIKSLNKVKLKKVIIGWLATLTYDDVEKLFTY